MLILVGNLIFRKNLQGWERPHGDVRPIPGSRTSPAILYEPFLTTQVETTSNDRECRASSATLNLILLFRLVESFFSWCLTYSCHNLSLGLLALMTTEKENGFIFAMLWYCLPSLTFLDQITPVLHNHVHLIPVLLGLHSSCGSFQFIHIFICAHYRKQMSPADFLLLQSWRIVFFLKKFREQGELHGCFVLS